MSLIDYVNIKQGSKSSLRFSNGTMSAWFIFSTLGFYPICPGKAEYVNIGRTPFDSVKICGKKFNPTDQGLLIRHDCFD